MCAREELEVNSVYRRDYSGNKRANPIEKLEHIVAYEYILEPVAASLSDILKTARRIIQKLV